MTRNTPFAFLLASTGLLGACASSGANYPSLEIRDAERVSGRFEAQSIVTPAPLRADFANSLAEIETGARAAHQAFLAAAPGARQSVAVARNAPIASAPWASAQIALGDLDSLRSQTAIMLGDLDLIYADAALAFEQRDALIKTRDLVTGFIRDEDAALADLRGELGG